MTVKSIGKFAGYVPSDLSEDIYKSVECKGMIQILFKSEAYQAKALMSTFDNGRSWRVNGGDIGALSVTEVCQDGKKITFNKANAVQLAMQYIVKRRTFL